jgi:MFS family permease
MVVRVDFVCHCYYAQRPSTDPIPQFPTIILTPKHNTKKLALGRVIGGMFGGFVPLAQSAVADLTPVEGRAKFLGRIQVGGLLHMCGTGRVTQSWLSIHAC